MAIHKIKSAVIVFNHPEYGERLLFQQGQTNPRNELGKNGVTVHHWPASMFYRTIKIEANQILENGQQRKTVFVVNRSSLIKYICGHASANDSDSKLIRILNNKLWKSELNNPTLEDKERQNTAGEHLRHAGQHNQRRINLWTDPIADSFKGNFLSWLYQVTIRSSFLIKVRFFFFGKEKNIFETGEILAKSRYHQTYAKVPAYRQHLKTFNGRAVDASYGDIPVTSKANYIKVQEHDSDLHWQGKYPEKGKTDTSTGTTGKPTAWVRSERELDTVKKSLALAAKIQFGNRKLNYVNAFALGPWATGLTTYELMRETGSVFATGPDKEKILDELVRITKYEKHQLELAVNNLQRANPGISEEGGRIITEIIDNTLKALLKNRDLKLADALDAQIAALSSHRAKAFMNRYKAKVRAIAETLNKEKSQIIIAGYPPFLKDLAAYIQDKGYSLADFSAIAVVGGQAISEAMRDLLIQDGFNQIYSSYGASDLDINLGVETEYEITVRKAIEQNPGLARELYGPNKGLPMVFHYDPWNYHVECLDEGKDEAHADDKDSLIFTATRNDRSSPRIRYDLGDKGRIYASSDVQALLAKYGIFQKPKTNLPLIFVWGRDSTVVFNGANLAFTELERAVTDIDTESKILKKAFYSYIDERTGEDKLEIWLELNDGIEMEDHEMNDYSQALFTKLAGLNQDFRYQLESLEEGTPLPIIRFFKRGASPISEAGGHRKQVLVFQKENLPEGFLMPGEDLCQAVGINMNDTILHPQPNGLVL
nr:hypothetical protein [Legionella jordanis]